MNKRRNAHLRYSIPGLMIAILLAGCSGGLAPPNIPRTGGTATLPAGQGFITPGAAGTAYPVETAAATATTGSPATAYPAATTAATAPAAATAPTGGAGTAYPAPTVASTATGGPTISSIPLPAQRQTIQFPAGGASFAVTITLQPNTAQAYQLQAANGQRMYITIDGNALMQLYDPNQSPLSGVLPAINPVQVSLSQTGTYYIALQGDGPVTMSVYIPAAGGSQNIPAPLPAQRPAIRFPAGATSASFSVNMNAAVPLAYTLNVRAGQQMTVTTNGGATVTLLAPDRATMVPSAAMPTHQWRYPLSQSGDYTLILLGSGPVNVTVSIPALSGGPTATAQPTPASSTRIIFAPGTASTKRTVNLTPGQPQAFVLGLQQGQTLYVSTTGSVSVNIYGPSNTVLTTGQAGFPKRWSAPANQTGDYTFVITGSGSSALEFYVPPR